MDLSVERGNDRLSPTAIEYIEYSSFKRKMISITAHPVQLKLELWYPIRESNKNCPYLQIHHSRDFTGNRTATE